MFIFQLTKLRFKMITLGLVFLSLSFVQSSFTGVARLNLPTALEQVKTEEKAMAITINVDWGEEFVPKMLDTLDTYQAKATFFVTGRWAANHPELLKTIALRGHQVENHGYFHSHPDQQTITKNKDELLRTEAVIQELIGKKTTFYAPPYGERGRNGLQAADELGYTTVLWTFDTIDWRADSTPQLIAQRVLQPKVRNGITPEKKGAIILMHPKENTVAALPQILSQLNKEGFELITIEKLITLELSGNTTP
jgi:peptidoglycan/xylan/chitin deacetylase (PgdA/CDA1 family)